ncbi:hypothetical protein FGO68_gene1757 [Halteria grandinella]|uniref:Uncharacterized protein n=1 Tax=Halteria grandinella TaxID=5974 RepID=A0A8J8NW03_HALGN|nr:hypothetical protein FGO68_gene1757 [Halteria grandinella]
MKAHCFPSSVAKQAAIQLSKCSLLECRKFDCFGPKSSLRAASMSWSWGVWKSLVTKSRGFNYAQGGFFVYWLECTEKVAGLGSQSIIEVV